MSTDWKRKDGYELAKMALQLGLSPEDAREALEVGARLLVHGFTRHEISEMIYTQYRIWAEEDEAVKSGKATVFQGRRWWGRKKRND